MDYKQKYKDALEHAKECLKDGGISQNSIDYIESIFPELKESGDERIRKAIIAFFKHEREEGITVLHYGVNIERMIAWLEKQGEEKKITHEEICKSYGIPDIGEFSDGYHTFNGLYKQRMILFAVLVKTYKDMAWKSWKHEDGLDCFGGGWFIVGIDTPAGTYTYHYEAKDWNRFDCQILEKAKHWDGHDEFDVERLFSLVSNDNKNEVIRCLINGMKFYYEGNEEATWGTEKFSMKVKDILSWLEKQGEHTDKVEPKFHEGEWIVHHGTENIYQVVAVAVIDKQYLLKYGDNYTIQKCADVDICARLWDITKDAKKGDVLSDRTTIFIFKDLLSDGSVMSYCDYDTDSGESDAFCPLSMNLMCSKITPATKEQRYALEKAMADAGYEWDAEKLELSKIEAEEELTEQKITRWSKEDSPYYDDICEILINLIHSKTANVNKDVIQKDLDWFISLKERYTLKPSDEQMKALKEACDEHWEPDGLDPLYTLYQDLKKLK